MFTKPSLLIRLIVGKSVGFILGLAGLIFLPFFYPEADWFLRWGILLWYTTIGGVIGMIGVFNYHPILHIPLPWWLRSSVIGAWFNFMLLFFAYDTIQEVSFSILGSEHFFSSPFWFTAEGAIVGLVIGFLATQFGGEGKETTHELPSL